MPRVVECNEAEPLELGDVIDALNQARFDPEDEESFAAAAPMLKGLAANRRFLGEIALAELKDRCSAQSLGNGYTPQVLMLHRASEKYFIRANFWPSQSDGIFRSSGASPFFYGVPHDHNFSFLTVGYHGPGYWSDYYEYDPRRIAGTVGEKVDLRFIERQRLDQGKVMLYRASRDVHNQLPADEMSISLNIVEASPRVAFTNQYCFDVHQCEIAAILSRTSTEALLALAANWDDGDARDLVENFAQRHPCERVRFSALRELAWAEPGLEAAISRLESSTAGQGRFISQMGNLEQERLVAIRGPAASPAPERS
jgi:hypothetical protein